MRRVIAVCMLLVGVVVTGQAAEAIYAMPDAERARNDHAVLIVPDTIDLEMVDGLVYKGLKGLFRKGETQVYIRPGERELALRYNGFFQTTPNDHDIIKSKVLVLRILAEPGKAYRASHAEFRNAAQARSAMDNFVLRILDGEGNNRVISASQVQKNWRGESLTTTRPDLVSESALADKAALAPVAGDAPAVAPAAPAGGGLNALELMKFTWRNASAADREAFLLWMRGEP